MVKQIPDRILKGMVLSAIEQGNSTTAEIRNHLATTPYFYESSEIDEVGNPTNSDYYIYSNYGGLRRELTYLRHQGYIRKLGKKPPHQFELTKTGIEHASNPFIKCDYKRNLMLDEARRTAESILENDDRFMEEVRKYTNKDHSNEITRMVEKPVIKLEDNVVEVDIGDGKTKQIEFSNGKIKAVKELTAVAEEQSRRLIEYEKIIQYYEQTITNNNSNDVKKLKREVTRQETISYRKELADYYFERQYLNQYFFTQWGNANPVTIEKKWDWRAPFQQGSVEIMSKNNKEFKRGHVNEIMDAELIAAAQFYIHRIMNKGIEIYGHGMTDVHFMKW